MISAQTSAEQGAGAPRRLLLMGGSTYYSGGLEAFCERAAQALERNSMWAVDHVETSTAHLRSSTVPAYLVGLRNLWRHRHDQPDVAWIQYGNLLDLTYVVLARLMGMRVMVTPHIGTGWRSQRNVVLRSLSRLMLRAADRLALISPTQEAELKLPASVPRTLIRTFLPEQAFEAPPVVGAALPPDLQLIHAGRLSEGKGTFLLVDVCARLRDAGVPFRARIIGQTDEATLARLRGAIADQQLGERVELIGHLSVTELIGELQRSDILVHLSRIDSYPLIVLEALASAALPLVMELAGARDMVANYGGAVVSQNGAAEEAASWIASLDLPALRGGRIAIASRIRADYGWTQSAAALDVALEACISQYAPVARHSAT